METYYLTSLDSARFAPVRRCTVRKVIVFDTGTPQFIHHGLEKLPTIQGKVDLWTNKKWINYQMMEGKNIVDVGGPSKLPSSDFYNMERQQVGGYAHYSQAGPDIQESFDLTGGVPH